MTALETICISALRLSSASANALIELIRENIAQGKAKLIQFGIPADAIDEDNEIIRACIVKYVKSEMDSNESERIRAGENFRLLADEARRSI